MPFSHTVITEYAQMWPREVYYIKKGKYPIQSLKDSLHNKTGVYVLYRDDHPYYIGQAQKSLWRRIRDHALRRNDRYYNFWNFFSVFVVPDKHHIDEVEGVLIAALAGVTANSKEPKIEPILLPEDIVKILNRETIISAHVIGS